MSQGSYSAAPRTIGRRNPFWMIAAQQWQRPLQGGTQNRYFINGCRVNSAHGACLFVSL